MSTRLVEEWVVFENKALKTRYKLSVTFLLSSWSCTYGHGCQGIHDTPTPELQQGCCTHGAHLNSPEEAEILVNAVAQLSDDDWQFRRSSIQKGYLVKSGKERKTRVEAGACVFLNRPDSGYRLGCVLHHLAIATDRPITATKPRVCWQLPFRVIPEEADDGFEEITIRAWTRSDWGEAGEDFAWWCTDHVEPAEGGTTPLFQRSQDELAALLDKSTLLELNNYLGTRASQQKAVRLLPPSQAPLRVIRRKT